MKGHSPCYKRNLMTQEKGFWRLRLWRASLGFSNLAQERKLFFGEERSELMFDY